jgi:hypothetical protein
MSATRPNSFINGVKQIGNNFKISFLHFSIFLKKTKKISPPPPPPRGSLTASSSDPNDSNGQRQGGGSDQLLLRSVEPNTFGGSRIYEQRRIWGNFNGGGSKPPMHSGPAAASLRCAASPGTYLSGGSSSPSCLRIICLFRYSSDD